MKLERSDDVAVLRLRGGKANSMSAAFLTDLVRLVYELEASDASAAVLIGDGPHFSAGLALPALVALDRPALREFMGLFAEAMLRVFRCTRPLVAAVNGHAIAGGCVLALECDTRIMADGAGKIGLSEVQLGIGLPAVVIEPLRLQVPATSLLPIALEGRLLAPSEALALRLVDEVVPTGLLEAHAVARARELGRAPRAGFAQVKASLRQPTLEAIERHGQAEGERWLDTWFSPEAQRRLGEQVARIEGKA